MIYIQNIFQNLLKKVKTAFQIIRQKIKDQKRKKNREVENIKIDDRDNKHNKGDGRKMTVLLLAEKREGKNKKQESNKNNNDYFNEDNAYGEGYEDYYGEDKEEQIEGMLNNENMQKTGMNQMTIDAIKNMVKIKKK